MEAWIGLLGTVLGTALGGAFTLRAARAGAKQGEAERMLRRLAAQVAAYHRLEGLASDRIAELTQQRPGAVKVALRDLVEEAGLARPEVTETQAKRILSDWT